jgi:PIN domain nuclease of toxin-antitoxin system
MNLLVDTHILIWYIAGNSSLKPMMTDLLETSGAEYLVRIVMGMLRPSADRIALLN